MDSRNFIQQATVLIKDIKDHQVVSFTRTHEEVQRTEQQIQKRLNNLFSSLQNPTLMTANKLADEALAAGFQVNQRVLDGLDQAERCWGN